MNNHKNTTLIRIKKTRLAELKNRAKLIGVPASVLLEMLLEQTTYQKIIYPKEDYEIEELFP